MNNLGNAYMHAYYCICPPNQIPICGFATHESAAKYKAERAIEGPIRYFNTQTMAYSEVPQ